jgi:hypothetical protein
MRTIVLISALLVVTAGVAAAQRTSATDVSISQVVDRMKSPTWTEREKAFDAAATLLAQGKLPAGDADSLRLGLIQLLAIENNEDEPTDSSSEQASENRSAYYSDLIGTVAGLRDERAIPALLAAAPTGGMATQGVARFGKKALDPVLEQIRGQDGELASGAAFVLRDMLEFRTVSDPDSHLRIKNALRSALASPDFVVRASAVSAIEFLDDREEFMPILKDLAEHDPFKLEGQPLADGTIGDVYFVRKDAKRVLLRIANHEPPAVDKRGLQY